MDVQQEREHQTVEYELTIDDVLAFHSHHTRSSSTIRRQQRLTVLLLLSCTVVFLMLVTIRLLFDPTSRPVLHILSELWWGWALIATATAAYFYQRRDKWRRRVWQRMIGEGENRNLIGRRKLSIGPEELREAWMFGETMLRWPAIERIVLAGEYAYLYVSATSALTVPKRAFPSDESFKRFVTTAQRYHRVHAPGRCKKCNYDLTGSTTARCPECGEVFR
jgi:hypothetical protein